MNILNALLLAALLSGGAAAEEQRKTAEDNAWKTRVFTAEELKKYDGKAGMPAYAAVDGVVYDLSGFKPWQGGRHMKQHDAGTDLSYDIHNKAPKSIHKDGKILEKAPKVGVLEEFSKERIAAAPPAAETAPAVEPQQPVKSPLAALHKVTKAEIGFETSCPVTGEKITVSEKTPSLDLKGKTYYFSSLSSLEKFSREPGKGLKEKIKGLFKKRKN